MDGVMILTLEIQNYSFHFPISQGQFLFSPCAICSCTHTLLILFLYHQDWSALLLGNQILLVFLLGAIKLYWFFFWDQSNCIGISFRQSNFIDISFGSNQTLLEFLLGAIKLYWYLGGQSKFIGIFLEGNQTLLVFLLRQSNYIGILVGQLNFIGISFGGNQILLVLLFGQSNFIGISFWAIKLYWYFGGQSNFIGIFWGAIKLYWYFFWGQSNFIGISLDNLYHIDYILCISYFALINLILYYMFLI